MKKTPFFLILLAILSINCLSQDKSLWFDKINQIKIGVSTKQDIEKLFKSIEVSKVNKFLETEDVFYKSKEGRLAVTYSSGKCTGNSDFYNLEVGLVIHYSFFPSEPIKMSKLKLNFQDFEKFSENDTSNFYYRNLNLGVMYMFSGNNLLTGIAKNLSDKEKQRFRCISS